MRDFNYYLNLTDEIGYVEQVTDAIIYVSGLPMVKPEEIVVFETGEFGQVFSIEPEIVEILIFSKNSIKPGVRVARTNESLHVPTGVELLGRVINPVGLAIDGERSIKAPKDKRPINVIPAGITKRSAITKPFETGVLIVDMAIPLGHGQRELVVGDRKTGKTSILTRSILTQTRKGNICIYGAIGKKKIDVKKIQEFFRKEGVLDKMIIVAAVSEDPAGLIYLTPYTAMAMSEYFRDQGKDVLVVLDDLSTHAKFYREIALLGKKFPGRNSYPSDIFYVHARLMERAGNFKTENGDGSITCFPVAETAQGDLSGYIETNLMSMTDGHLYFDKDLFYLGRRPAVNPFLSVTRVGRQTQTNLRREINREIISFLNLYEKLQAFVHFGAELNESIKATLATGEKIIRFFNQETNETMPLNLQIVIFCMIWVNVIGNKDPLSTKKEISNLYNAYHKDPKFKADADKLTETASFNSLLGIVKKQGQELVKASLIYDK